MRYLARLQPIALLVLRIVVGAIMIGHGYHKVFGGGMMEHYHHVQSVGLPGVLAFPSAFAEFLVEFWFCSASLPVMQLWPF